MKKKRQRRIQIDKDKIEELVRANLTFFGLDASCQDSFYLEIENDYYAGIECYFEYQDLETDEEFNARLVQEKHQEEIKRKRLETKKKNEEAREIKLLEKLKAKYPND